jgi:quercetin dioxygenase-like cupin family protein
MNIENVPFNITDWKNVPAINHPGLKGMATWRTLEMGNIRVRIVDYSPGYIADHWCNRGHVIYVLEGELVTELSDGRKFLLTPGMSYQVGEDANAHRSVTTTGAKMFVVD